MKADEIGAGAALAALRKKGTFVCEYCGDKFEARANPPPRYCCNSHRASAHNREKRKAKSR